MSTAKAASDASPAKELLCRKESGTGPCPPRPLDHLAFAILLESGAEAAEGLAALARLRRDFVDWNEVRVARIQEIIRVLGPGVPDAERAALRIREEYNAFFEKKGALGFEFLGAGKPAESRRVLVQQFPNLGKGAVSLLLYEFCAGSSFPLSDDGLRQARKDGIAGKSADRNQLAKALAESLTAGEVVLLLQHWEIEATGHPYGESGKKESSQAAKKAKKTTAKAKPKTNKK